MDLGTKKRRRVTSKVTEEAEVAAESVGAEAEAAEEQPEPEAEVTAAGAGCLCSSPFSGKLS